VCLRNATGARVTTRALLARARRALEAEKG